MAMAIRFQPVCECNQLAPFGFGMLDIPSVTASLPLEIHLLTVTFVPVSPYQVGMPLAAMGLVSGAAWVCYHQYRRPRTGPRKWPNTNRIRPTTTAMTPSTWQTCRMPGSTPGSTSGNSQATSSSTMPIVITCVSLLESPCARGPDTIPYQPRDTDNQRCLSWTLPRTLIVQRWQVWVIRRSRSRSCWCWIWNR